MNSKFFMTNVTYPRRYNRVSRRGFNKKINMRLNIIRQRKNIIRQRKNNK